MTSFSAEISTVFLRFILMMIVVIIAGFSGQWWLAILALPIFLTAVCGVKFMAR